MAYQKDLEIILGKRHKEITVNIYIHKHNSIYNNIQINPLVHFFCCTDINHFWYLKNLLILKYQFKKGGVFKVNLDFLAGLMVLQNEIF